MSPTVLRQDGYQFVIYSNDHPPAHIHVLRAENGARVQLEPIQVLDNWGFNSREISKIIDIVREHHSELLAEWNRRRQE